jgi:prepilin-type N-terminal cleavage/methylation domain-containing protein
MFTQLPTHSAFSAMHNSRHRPMKPTSKRAGFTIIEVAIASAILAVSIIGALVIASQSMLMLQTTREFSRANQILQQRMEDIRLLRFTAIQALPSTFTDPNDPKHIYAGTITKQTYRTDGSGKVASLKVTLSVTWKGRNGIARGQTLSTVFADGGLNEYIF